MTTIKKIQLSNFKRFRNFSIDLDEKINLLIGDNEAGKSTILTAVEIVLSGSRTKVEMIGLDNIINLEAINEFLKSDRKYENLPKVSVELYLSEHGNPDLNGRDNSAGIDCDGLSLICEPNDDLSDEIKKIIGQEDTNFPFEYYSINFRTFSGEGYTNFRKFLKYVVIDNSHISNEYAMRDYIKTMYEENVQEIDRNKNQNEYRRYKEEFRKKVLSDVNDKIKDYAFVLKTGSKANLETDLTISEGEISIENKGKGRQCFIKTDFALKKKNKGDVLDVILIEEPENHLSHTNMKKLINKISDSSDNQLFIATHSDLISKRLDLRKSILLNSSCSTPLMLKNLPESTAKYFIKAPDNNILEFILSKKVILVEGDAEYILMEEFYNNITKGKMYDSNIHVISVGGTSFKRYLDIAKLLNIKTAVIRDNDNDYQGNCVNNYVDYICENIRIFSDKDNIRYTFEVALYLDNSVLCNELFGAERKTLSVQDYMLKNKADVAFELLDKRAKEIFPPSYIREAIEWIKE